MYPQKQLDHDFRDHLPDGFFRFGAKELMTIAAWHENQARILKNRALQVQKMEETNARASAAVKRLEAIPRRVLSHIGQTGDVPASIALTAAEYGVTVQCVEIWFRNEMKHKKAEFIRHRDHAIVMMVRLGLSNRKIARRLGIHYNTVTRAIQRVLGCKLTSGDRAALRHAHLSGQPHELPAIPS